MEFFYNIVFIFHSQLAPPKLVLVLSIKPINKNKTIKTKNKKNKLTEKTMLLPQQLLLHYLSTCINLCLKYTASYRIHRAIILTSTINFLTPSQLHLYFTVRKQSTLFHYYIEILK